MRALLAALGSRGDVQPMLSLARALRAAGHEVVVSAPPDFAAWAADLGLSFACAGASTEAMLQQHKHAMGANPWRVLQGMKRMFLDNIPTWFDHVMRAAQGAHVIAYAGQLAAPSVAEKLGIPCLGVAYSPTVLRSSHHPPLLMTPQRLPLWMNALGWRVSEVVVNALVRKSLNGARRRLGLAPVASVQPHVFGDSPFLFAADPVIAPPPPDWDALEVITTGPWFYDDAAPLAAEVEAFLDAGPPPVYVGFGSMVALDPAAMTHAVVEGARRAGRRVLLSKGWAGIGAGALPADAMAVHGPMPHAKLFSRVAAVVHHGGAGTMNAALRAQAPQIIVPHVLDQYYYAHRLETLGLAPPAVPVARLTAAKLGRAIEAALALPDEPRRQAAARLRAGDGVQRAVAAIVAKTKGPPRSGPCVYADSD